MHDLETHTAQPRPHVELLIGLVDGAEQDLSFLYGDLGPFWETLTLSLEGTGKSSGDDLPMGPFSSISP